jgi:hypothetical protein
MKCLYLPLFLAVVPVLAAAPALAGAWKLSLNVNGNTYPIVCSFQQDGEKLAGTCKSESGENPVKGEIQDQKISFQHQTPYNGNMIMLTYSGTITSASEIKGMVDVQPFNVSGDFTGQKDTPAEGK